MILILWGDHKDSLTIGRNYIIIRVSSSLDVDDDEEKTLITIIDNYGKKFGYYDHRFIGLKAYRRMKLDELNKVNKML